MYTCWDLSINSWCCRLELSNAYSSLLDSRRELDGEAGGMRGTRGAGDGHQVQSFILNLGHGVVPAFELLDLF